METQPNIDMAVYLRHLANGTPINVDLASPEAKAAIERGKKLTTVKVGQQNFTCNDCHETGANRWVRGQYLAAYKGAYAHFPTFRTSQGGVWDFPRRLQWCNVAVRANELMPDAPEARVRARAAEMGFSGGAAGMSAAFGGCGGGSRRSFGGASLPPQAEMTSSTVTAAGRWSRAMRFAAVV